MDALEDGTLVSNETPMWFVCTASVGVSVSSEIERRKKLIQRVDFLELIRPGARSFVRFDRPAYTGYRRCERVSRYEASVSLCSLYGLCRWLERVPNLRFIGT